MNQNADWRELSELPQVFTRLMFAGLDEDQLEGWDPAERARLARSAFEFVAVRAAGAAKARVYTLDGESLPRRLTVIEIINDDMPFLLDSVLGEIQDQGLIVRLVAHPVFTVDRNQHGALTRLGSAEGKEAILDIQTGGQESFIHIHVEDEMSADAAEQLLQRLSSILDQIRSVVEDRRPMIERLLGVIDAMERAPVVPGHDLGETKAFLQWLVDGNFIFLGMREYAFVQGSKGHEREPVAGASFGLLRDPERMAVRRPGDLAELSFNAQSYFFHTAPLLIAKASFRSDVHRRVHADCCIIKLYSTDGQATGELRMAGLFTASAYNFSTLHIPLLRNKVKGVIFRSGHNPVGHTGKALLNVLETFPRDELFQIEPEQLSRIAEGIASLALRPRTRVFVRRDGFGRFISALVYVPRERFTTQVREEICAYLARAHEGYISEHTPFFTQGPMVRLHVVIWRKSGRIADIGENQLETRVARIIRTWRDELKDQLHERFGPSAAPLIAKYLEAFPPSYEESNSPFRAMEDIQRIERLSPGAPIGIDLFLDGCSPPNQAQAALYQIGEPITLSRRVPIFENLGFSVIAEQTYRVEPGAGASGKPGGPPVFLHDMMLATEDGAPVDLAQHDERLEECFLAVWRGDAANDRFNGLIRKAGFTWREAALFRAYGAYLRQIGTPFSQDFLAHTVTLHAAAAANLLGLFRTALDPQQEQYLEDRDTCADMLIRQFEARIETVKSLDEDRVLRRFLNLIKATKRSNFYLDDKTAPQPPAVAFKLASGEIEYLPRPRPYAEIFVYSTRFEGIHLRFGKVARGGIRWSDRRQDFRTEVLALAKAQQVKNTVIVPRGAKGGFALKTAMNEATPAERQAEGVTCYKTFIENLLTLTDNYEKGGTTPLTPIVRRDGDDPYLVVAADKGTARFSDLANAISIRRQFWLGDAFASGGSIGYDHKAMAVTARGAWETVKRHFREMNIDARTAPLRIIGVGDMSGDVFGNGMLLSRNLRLIAAFDHRDIFIDPNPDPALSFAERKRLFELPGSSWQDYDRARLSPGGGVLSRAAKSVALTPEMRALLGVGDASLPPGELIRAALMAEADLLWFGGVGAFVRASTESDVQAGDRANDAIRITADQLRVKVVGEGANLGMTQRARVEFAMRGGRINTDAIDNSAGVNCSDIEVNIKIALSGAVRKGALSGDERNALLHQMTDDVAAACLRNNYLQSLALSLGERRGVSELGFQRRLMHELETRGLLDRDLEGLPGDIELAGRARRDASLTRPELAVLLAYAKMDLEAALNASPLPDDPYMQRVLEAYFPSLLRQRFAAEIASHQLRREIIATSLANEIINRGGSTFVVRLSEETGSALPDVACAFVAVRDIFDLDRLFSGVDALDGKIDGGRQLELYTVLQDLLRRQTAWFLRHGKVSQGLADVIALYRAGLDGVKAALSREEDASARNSRARCVNDGVPEPLADDFAAIDHLASGPDIVLTARRLGRPEELVARGHLGVGAYFRLDELRAASERITHNDYFDRLALSSGLDALAEAWRSATASLIAHGDSAAPDVEAWIAGNSAGARVKRGIDDILNGGVMTLAKLTVAVASLRDLTPNGSR